MRLSCTYPMANTCCKQKITPRDPTPEEVKTAEELEKEEQAGIAKQIAKHPEDEKQIRLQHELGNTPTYLDALDVNGPFNGLPPPLPESYKRIFICGHAPGQHTAKCARTDLQNLANLAFRRPATNAEVAKFTRLVDLGQKNGLSFEQSMRLGVEAILVSPQFLYRLEQDPQPADVAAVHPVNDYELASRLSYFLWSSMPDEELLDLASEQKLSQPRSAE